LEFPILDQIKVEDRTKEQKVTELDEEECQESDNKSEYLEHQSRYQKKTQTPMMEGNSEEKWKKSGYKGEILE